MNKPKLLIIYRYCDLEHDGKQVRNCRPKNFNKRHNFYSLFGWDSHLKSDEYFDIDIHIVFDGEPEQYSENPLYLEYQPEPKVFCTSARGNQNSYITCLDHAKAISLQNQKSYDLFYFLEDDYYHSPSWSKILLDGYLLACRDKRTIISLYDHPDRYTRRDDIDYGLELILGNNSHWRTSESTTCTWAITPEDYNEIYPTARHFGINDRQFFRTAIQNYGYRLITPIPSPATHLHIPYMSPFSESFYSCAKSE